MLWKENPRRRGEDDEGKRTMKGTGSKSFVPDEIQSTTVNHVLVNGMSMKAYRVIILYNTVQYFR